MDTKTALRQHARILFARHGYNGVSMRDIAGIVGIRQSAIYNHFASKQDLLCDLMETHMHTVLTQVQQALNGITGDYERLSVFIHFHINHHIQFPDDVFLAYMEIRSLEPDNKNKIIKMRDKYETTLKKILTDGTAMGTFDIPEPTVQTKAILSMLTGVTVWYKETGILTPESIAKTYEEIIMRSVNYKAQ